MPDLEKLDNAINELEKQSNSLRDFSSVYAEIAKLKQDIADNLKLLEENNHGLSEVSKETEKYLAELQRKIEEIFKDNKSFQKELDGSITSRLEKHRSDIQVEIRDQGTQAQRAFETTLNSIFNQMESKFKAEFDRQVKQLSTLKILMLVLIAMVLGVGVGIFIMK